MAVITREKGKVHNDTSRDNYWTRIHLKSEKTDKQTFLYVCASHEYLGNVLSTNHFKENQVSGWVDTVVSEWEEKGESIFKKPFHLEVRANTADGHQNGVEFLKNEIVPLPD